MVTRSRTFKALIFASSNAATAVVTLVIAAVLSRVFDKVDYATYRQTLLVYQFSGPLLALGLPAALFYFLPGETSRIRAVLLENLILLGVLGGSFSLFLVLGGNVFIAEQFSNPELEETLLVFALYPVLFLPTTAVSAVLVVQEKVQWLFLHTVATRLSRLFLVLGVVWLCAAGPLGAVGAMTVSGGIVFASGIYLMLRAVPRSEVSRPTFGGMRLQLKYAVPIGLALMLEKLALGIDQVLVSMLCSPEEFAVFVNGAMEIPFIRMITVPVTAIMLPELVAMYKNNRKAEAHQLWQKAARKVSVVLLPIGGGLFVIAPELMTLLYSGDYTESSRPFRVYLLLLPARVIFFGAIFQAAGRPDLILRRAIGTLILNTLVSYPLVYFFGIEGAAWGTVIVFWGYVIPYCMCLCSRLLGVHWGQLMPWRHIGVVLLAVVLGSCCALGVGRLFTGLEVMVAGGIAITVYFAVVGLLCLYLVPDEVKSYARSMQRQISKLRNKS